MSSTLFECVICKEPIMPVTKLLHHYQQCHTLLEMSVAVINLQEVNYLKYENNNHETTRAYSIVKTESRNSPKLLKNTETIGLEMWNKLDPKSCHDEAYCLTHCAQFLAWESELNGRNVLSDEEFYRTVDAFCNDLENVKRKERKKRNIGSSVEEFQTKKTAAKTDDATENSIKMNCTACTPLALNHDHEYCKTAGERTDDDNKDDKRDLTLLSESPLVC